MSATIALLRRSAKRARELWAALWLSGQPGRPHGPCLSFGQLPVRPAIRDPREALEEQATATKEEARANLAGQMARWPFEASRLAVEAGTGLGKTTLAVARAALHITESPVCEKALLFVAHDKQRVSEIVELVRAEVEALGGDAGRVAPLLGRQPIDVESGEGWGSRSFGCVNHERVRLFGQRLRGVRREVCKPCPARGACEQQGYLGHLKAVLSATVLVTTLARLVSLSEAIWDGIGAVICDEDVTPGLREEFRVVPSDLRRAVEHIERQRRSEPQGADLPPRLRALLQVMPLLKACLEVVQAQPGSESAPLVDLLPPECEPYLTRDGATLLRAAFPLRTKRTQDGTKRVVREEGAMAEWERLRGGWTPRQVSGRLLSALAADCSIGDSARAATVRVERSGRRRGRARLQVTRFDARTLRHLRGRPLLLLDATLHPAIAPLLDVERVRIECRTARRVLQVLTKLQDVTQLSQRHGEELHLTRTGTRVLAQIAHLVNGHRAYVLCRTGLRDSLRREAGRYYELARTEFVTVRRERGWDDKRAADVFVVLGRYARDPDSCLREAHALRSVYRALTGSTERLDSLEAPARPPMFRGRGRALSYYGTLLERPRRNEMPDRLAQLLQDADRIASVTQFMGRNRTDDAFVVLHRGDPTIAADALVHVADLPEALPTAARARARKDSCAAQAPSPAEEQSATGRGAPVGQPRQAVPAELACAGFNHPVPADGANSNAVRKERS